MNSRTWMRAVLYAFVAFVLAGQPRQRYDFFAMLRDPDSSPVWPFFFDWRTLRVTRVLDPGQAGGLLAGDIIAERGVSGVYAQLRDARAGRTCTLAVRRGEATLQLPVVLVPPRTGDTTSGQRRRLYVSQFLTYWA